MKLAVFVSCFAGLVFTQVSLSQSDYKPVIDGEWWQMAGMPDMGEYSSGKEEPVDFGLWQAEDGTWQLWFCIRKSNYLGTSYTTRILYGWEGKDITSRNWDRQGIKWVGDASLGETQGGMQAPYVIKEDGFYYLFYGDWKRICLAKSLDGKDFSRVLGGNGRALWICGKCGLGLGW